jgi:hypothetical protein
MLAGAALEWRQGLFRAALQFVNVLLCGLLTFNFWEPLAHSLGSLSPSMDPYADALWLATLFVLFFVVLRLATLLLAPTVVAFPPLVQRLGACVFGALTGYLLAGFLICMLQTLPLPERFFGYDPGTGMGMHGPDRVWLALTHRASGVVFDRPGDDERWFDADASFVHRHARYRRFREGRSEPFRNQGEYPERLDTHLPVSKSFEP